MINKGKDEVLGNQIIIKNLVDAVSLLQKRCNEIESAWDIIRTLSPESVPIDRDRINNSIFSYKQKNDQPIKQMVSHLKQSLSNLNNAYDMCPYSDDSDISIELSKLRVCITNIINQYDS